MDYFSACGAMVHALKREIKKIKPPLFTVIKLMLPGRAAVAEQAEVVPPQLSLSI